MGLFNFWKDAGEKVIAENKTAENETGKNVDELSQSAANAICGYIERQELGIDGLAVDFQAQAGTVTLTGVAPDQAACEKAALAAGNIQGVSSVDNHITIKESVAAESASVPAARYHDVESGETLSAIAKQYYSDANQYMKIFEANQPMLSSPDKIYPGQKLRIPT